MKLTKLLGIVMIAAMFVPGYAFSWDMSDLTEPVFVLSTPSQVVVGQEFEVTVYIFALDWDVPTGICGYQYGFAFDDTVLQLLPDVVDHKFFDPSEPGFPISTVPFCMKPYIGYFDLVQETYNPAGPPDWLPLDPQPTPVLRPTATFKFMGLATGCTDFMVECGNLILPCGDTVEPQEIDVIYNAQCCVIEDFPPKPVPTLSQYGAIILMIMTILTGVVYVRRRRNVR